MTCNELAVVPGVHMSRNLRHLRIHMYEPMCICYCSTLEQLLWQNYKLSNKGLVPNSAPPPTAHLYAGILQIVQLLRSVKNYVGIR